MKMTNEEYAAYIRSKLPKSPFWADLAKAFVIGGLICCVGQGFLELYGALGMSQEDAAAWCSVTMVFLGAFLTGLGVLLALHAGRQAWRVRYGSHDPGAARSIHLRRIAKGDC